MNNNTQERLTAAELDIMLCLWKYTQPVRTARLLEDLACVAAAVLEGAEGLGLPLAAAARCAEGCGEVRRAMDRSLNQKLLFTLLAAKLCEAAG